MILSFKLTWRNLLGNPVRTLLTALGMIAAASVVSWMVAGYDSLFSQFNHDPERMEGRFNGMVIARPGHTIPQSAVSKLEKWVPPQDRKLFYQSIRVNAKNAKDLPAGKQRRGGDSSVMAGGPGRGSGRGPGGPLAPVSYGLPTGGGVPLVGVSAVQSPYSMESGIWLNPLQKGDLPAAVISQSLAKRFQVGTNDVLLVASHGGFDRLQICGIMTDGPESRKYQNLEKGLDVNSSQGIFVLPETMRRIAGGNDVPVASVMIGGDANQIQLWETAKQHLTELPDVAQSCILADYESIRSAMNKPAPGSERGRSMAQAYSATGISMLVSFFIIFTTLSMGVEERIRQFAILRAVAFRRYQIGLMILLESLLLGLIGWVGGLASGSLLLVILKWNGNNAVSMKIGFWTILLTGICSVAGAVAASLLPMYRAASVRPLEAMHPQKIAEGREVSLVPTVIGLVLLSVNPIIVSLEGLNDMTLVMLYAFVGCPTMVIGFVCLAPVLLRVSGKILYWPFAKLFRLSPVFLKSQLEANLWRSLGTVVSLSVGLGFFMMTLIWSSSMLIPYIPGEWMPECFLSIVPGGLSDSTAAKISRIPGVVPGQCLPVAVEQVKLKEDLTASKERQSAVRQDNITMLGVAPGPGFGGSKPLFPFRFLSGDREEAVRLLNDREVNYCLIPHYFAATARIEGHAIRKGDTFEVLSPSGELVSFRVAGIVEMYGWHWFSKTSGTRRHFPRTAALVFASEATLKRVFDLDRVNYLWMNLEKDADQEQVLAAVRKLSRESAGEEFRVLETGGTARVGREVVRQTTKSGLLNSLMGRTETIVEGMLKMPLLILLVVSLSVANTAVASVRSRKREIGIMRAVGLGAWGLFRLLMAETILIAIAAVILSFGFGICSGLCSAQMAAHSSFFGGMGWSFDIPWMRLCEGALFTLVLCLGAALIPAWFWHRKQPLELLQSVQE